MRTIKWSNTFQRDYRRIKSTPRHARDIDVSLTSVSALLAGDIPLPARYQDHALSGDWKGYRECHLKPDLLLVYKTEIPGILRFARLGSHAQIFG